MVDIIKLKREIEGIKKERLRLKRSLVYKTPTNRCSALRQCRGKGEIERLDIYREKIRKELRKAVSAQMIHCSALRQCKECNKPLKSKEQNECSKCGEIFCGKHIFYYVDGNNIAITRNSEGYCRNCYYKKYKEK